MILVARRQPNHTIGASVPAFAGSLASPQDRASDAAQGTRFICFHAAACSRSHRLNRIQQISANFRPTATRAICRLERLRTRS
jgi:hypothetical protein